jgi:hypothetical protein
MMHARTRRELMDEMMSEYDQALVHSLVDVIAEGTNKSCIETVEMVLEAWQRSKNHTLAEIIQSRRCSETDVSLN